jgi:hypothetical protein
MSSLAASADAAEDIDMNNRVLQPLDPPLSEWLALKNPEKLWVSYCPFLVSRGYRLRPRYNPDWVPFWTLPGNKRNAVDCENSLQVWLVHVVHRCNP